MSNFSKRIAASIAFILLISTSLPAAELSPEIDFSAEIEKSDLNNCIKSLNNKPNQSKAIFLKGLVRFGVNFTLGALFGAISATGKKNNIKTIALKSLKGGALQGSLASIAYSLGILVKKIIEEAEGEVRKENFADDFVIDFTNAIVVTSMLAIMSDLTPYLFEKYVFENTKEKQND